MNFLIMWALLSVHFAGSLSALVYQHTISAYALPCKLLLHSQGRPFLHNNGFCGVCVWCVCVCNVWMYKNETQLFFAYTDLGAAEERADGKQASEDNSKAGGTNWL